MYADELIILSCRRNLVKANSLAKESSLAFVNGKHRIYLAQTGS